MNKIAVSLIAAVSIAAVSLSTATVFAEDRVEQSAEQSQTLKVVCTSGAYGQESHCDAEGSQSQKLHQLITYSKVLGTNKIHTPVDTAVDPAMMGVVLAFGLSGIGAFIGYTRLQ